MMQKTHIESFLRINNISVAAPDEEIRKALVYAHWSEKDAESALMTLRGVVSQETTNMQEAKHALFHTDAHISSETLTALFGVRVTLPPHVPFRIEKAGEERTFENIKILGIAVTALLCAAFLFIGTMYIADLGPFYTPV